MEEVTVPHGAARRTVVLLSGGLDSATVAAWAVRRGDTVTALSVDYGQRHAVELEAAARIAAALEITDHVVLAVDLAACGGSALVDRSIAVPKDRPAAALAAEIPVTYVPARNTVFLALALAVAETRRATAIALGVNAVDYSGYPDCRPEFIAAFARLATLATKAGVEGTPLEIVTPLLHLGKADIVRLGIELGLDHGLTTSCYDPAPDGRPCGRCDSCRIRAAGFAAAGAVDPRAHTG
ncbi:MAG: 7-cyano-7-deazaguanine synthase QueC [Planctomycetota bacterium]